MGCFIYPERVMVMVMVLVNICTQHSYQILGHLVGWLVSWRVFTMHDAWCIMMCYFTYLLLGIKWRHDLNTKCDFNYNDIPPNTSIKAYYLITRTLKTPQSAQDYLNKDMIWKQNVIWTTTYQEPQTPFPYPTRVLKTHRSKTQSLYENKDTIWYKSWIELKQHTTKT